MKSTSSTYIDYAFLGLGCGNSLMLLQLAEEGLLAGKHILVIEPDSNGTNNRTFCFWMDPERVRSSFFRTMVSCVWTFPDSSHPLLDSLKHLLIGIPSLQV